MTEQPATTPILTVSDLHAAYDGEEVLGGLDLALQPGETVGLLGPNGSGKSTLLRVISGLLAPRAGTVQLLGRPLGSYSDRQRARLIGLVPQYATIPFAFSVYDVVAMGRHPYIGLMSPLGTEDREAVTVAMRRSDCLHLQERLVTELSGGELQRVFIARALAQQPQLLLLDEPTAHLDINHQLEIAGMLRQLHREQGLTVLWVSHDLNLAGEFCDRLVMLSQGRVVADGSPAEVLTAEMLLQVYGASLQVAANPLSGRPQIVISAGGERP